MPAKSTAEPRPVFRNNASNHLRTGVYALVVLTAGAYLPSPLYPSYQVSFAINDLAMTVVYATFSLFSAPALVLFGSASDVWAARSVLRISLLVAAAGSACFACASGQAWLIAARAAQGIALGAVTSAASTVISVGTHERGLDSGVLTSAAFVGGTAAGPIAGGLLAEYAPAPHLLPFLLHLVLLWIGWRRVSALPGPPASRMRQWKPARPHIPTGMRGLFTTSALTGFLAWTVAGLFLSVIPMLLNRTATGPALVGGVLGAVLSCSVLIQPLVAHLGARRAQLVGLIALLVSLTLLALTTGTSTPVTLLAAVIAGAGHGLAYGGATTAIEARAPDEQRGAVTGALHVAFYLGAGCPAVAIGLITLALPLSTATMWVSATAATLVPFAVSAVAVLRRSPRTRP